MEESFDYTTVEWCCPQCRTPLKYVGYTAFTCHNCKRGYSIRRHDTLQEMEQVKKTPLHEGLYL